MDEDASGNALSVASVRVANVLPAHGRAAFSVERVGQTNAYQLMTNASHLDYERFTAAELNANGKAIIRLPLRPQMRTIPPTKRRRWRRSANGQHDL